MQYGIDAPKYLDGMFSFVLYDKEKDRMVAARDPIGITSFYMGRSSQTPGTVFFASELKALAQVCDNIQTFPPGHVYDSQTDKLTRYFQPSWWDPARVPSDPIDYKLIRRTLERSVLK
ncbi:MAG: asparagine synthetase, partial [Watsoniomyces obsoletus]